MYRNYKSNNSVELLYEKMYSEQTYQKKLLLKNNLKFDKPYYISNIIPYLNNVIDSSDPDTDLPQIYHGYQTAEAIRNNYIINDINIKKIYIKDLFSDSEWNNIPSKYKNIYMQTISQLYSHINNWSWLPLIGLIHDLGKVLVLDNFGKHPEHFSVGDIYPLGCKFSPANIYYDKSFHHNNPDFNISKYNSLYGIYSPNIGFKNIEMTFSHDYYLSHVLFNSKHNFPYEAIYIIQFHSFYAWHTPKNISRGYTHLASHQDWILLPLLKLFQKSDLYSKTIDIPDIDTIKPYYLNLISLYIHDTLNF